jgi:hypothetical protein
MRQAELAEPATLRNDACASIMDLRKPVGLRPPAAIILLAFAQARPIRHRSARDMAVGESAKRLEPAALLAEFRSPGAAKERAPDLNDATGLAALGCRNSPSTKLRQPWRTP